LSCPSSLFCHPCWRTNAVNLKAFLGGETLLSLVSTCYSFHHQPFSLLLVQRALGDGLLKTCKSDTEIDDQQAIHPHTQFAHSTFFFKLFIKRKRTRPRRFDAKSTSQHTHPSKSQITPKNRTAHRRPCPNVKRTTTKASEKKTTQHNTTQQDNVKGRSKQHT
jgi:hypothetical protein